LGTGANAVTEIHWDFGDGTTVIDTNVSTTIVHKHIYQNAGKY